VFRRAHSLSLDYLQLLSKERHIIMSAFSQALKVPKTVKSFQGTNLNLRGAVEHMKMAQQWSFIKPVYENMEKGDEVYVRYVDDYNTANSMFGKCLRRNRSAYGARFELYDKDLEITRSFPFFSPLLLNIEIRNRKQVEDANKLEKARERRTQKKKKVESAAKLEMRKYIAKVNSVSDTKKKK
ncbi:hypothetical protein PROFUN_16009, partial [Planoprotostelium fungivorum]